MPAATAPATTRKKRRPYRRDQILSAAIDLFHERGYHATGMDDIGAAAGITGPGIYRHFRNKEDILETAVRESAIQALEDVKEVVERSGSPRDTIDRLVDYVVHALVDNPAFTAVALHERRNLNRETRLWIERIDKEYVENWAKALRQLRPELAEAEARMMVRGTQGMCLTVAQYRTGIAAPRLAEMLSQMVLSALLTEPAPAKPRRSKSR